MGCEIVQQEILCLEYLSRTVGCVCMVPVKMDISGGGFQEESLLGKFRGGEDCVTALKALGTMGVSAQS